MRNDDAELERMRAGISCATLLERHGWLLDREESTRRAPKYRRGEGEILIVNHDGRGWWDPTGTAKGDVFALAQRLNPGLNFGEIRKLLRPLVGLAPTWPTAHGNRQRRAGSAATPAERWSTRPPLCGHGPVWTYLTLGRGLPPVVLNAASRADILREGAYGNAWFAHRDTAGEVSHVEIRGPDYRGALAGGQKALFRLATAATPKRLAITEAPIDALSLAALEGMRPDTLYAATGGGIGPGTETALDRLLAGLVGVPGAVLLAASDANDAGERHAARLAEIAGGRIACERLRPVEGVDWNDVLRSTAGEGRGGEGRGA